MPPWKCRFNEQWTKKLEYSDRLEPGSNKYSARCRLCMKSFGISNMGEAALKSHNKGTKHLELLQKWKRHRANTIQGFFTEKATNKTKQVEKIQ